MQWGRGRPRAPFFATRLDARRRQCEATRATRGDDCWPHTPHESRGPGPSLGVGRASHVWLSEVWSGGLSAGGPPTWRRAGMAVQETGGGATVAAPISRAGPATRPRGWGSADRPGG